MTDLDLMSNANRLDQPRPARPPRRAAGLDPGTEVETARDGYLFVRLGGGVGAALFYYPYPLVRAVRGALAASPWPPRPTSGLMKLGAIISRGSRRDFVDLYLLCRQLPLADLLDLARGQVRPRPRLPPPGPQGLADLSEIEGEPMPRLARRRSTGSEVEAWLRDAGAGDGAGAGGAH